MSNLCFIRKRSKVTQIGLANKSGVSISTIRRIEAGSNPNVSVLRKIANALGCTVEELIREKAENEAASYQAVADEGENGFTAEKGETFLQSVYTPVITPTP